MLKGNNMKLTSPLGEISFFIDDNEIEYSYKALKSFECCPDINGRYIIEIAFMPDGKEHSISCVISNSNKIAETDFESGEYLECQAFYSDNIKISIGLEGDNGYDPDTGRRESEFDFDVDYLNDGMAYSILPFTKTQKYLFGISWLSPYNEENDVQTWYAADPFYYKKGY